MDYSFDMNNIVQTAFLLNVHVNEIIEASKTIDVRPHASISLPNNCKFGKEYKQAFCYKVDGTDGIVVNCSGTPTEYQQIFILAYAYLVTKPNPSSNLDRLKNYLNDFIRRKDSIKNAELNIVAYIGAIKSEYDAIARLHINVEDMQLLFKKICRRLKVKYEFADDLHRFTFKNITIGNEVEGYLRYKTVTVIADDELAIKEIIYGFNGFTYSSKWNLSLIGHMHPHISGNNICYGNRAGDFTLYKTAGAFDFLLLLIKESLETYDSHNPFEHLGNIISRVQVLESVVQLGEVQENGVTITQSSNPRRYAELLLNKIKRCPHCSAMLMSNPIDPHASISCTNLGCHANPNADIRCRRCEQTLVRGSWSQANQRYNYECHNTRDNCSESVAYKEYMKRKRKIDNALKKIREGHFTIGTFMDANGNERSAILHDKAYVPCPYCNEPLDAELVCRSSSRSNPCRGHRFYRVDQNYEIVDKLIDDYIAQDESKLPEFPDNIWELHPESSSSIVGKLLGKKYVELNPTTILSELRYDSSYAYHYNSGDCIFRYREFYTEYIRAGNPRIPHVDEFYRDNHGIIIN